MKGTIVLALVIMLGLFLGFRARLLTDEALAAQLDQRSEVIEGLPAAGTVYRARVDETTVCYFWVRGGIGGGAAAMDCVENKPVGF